MDLGRGSVEMPISRYGYHLASEMKLNFLISHSSTYNSSQYRWKSDGNKYNKLNKLDFLKNWRILCINWKVPGRSRHLAISDDTEAELIAQS